MAVEIRLMEILKSEFKVKRNTGTIEIHETEKRKKKKIQRFYEARYTDRSKEAKE